MFGGDPQYPHGGYLPALRQEAFEGLKAYRCPDGKVRVFRMDENAKRLQSTCRGILMPELLTERFEEMVKKVVRLNERFIPAIRERGHVVHPSAAYRYGSPSGRASGQRIPLRDFRHAGRAVLQGSFAANPYVIIREFDVPHRWERVSIKWAATMRRA